MIRSSFLKRLLAAPAAGISILLKEPTPTLEIKPIIEFPDDPTHPAVLIYGDIVIHGDIYKGSKR